jgi:DnaA family protein
MKQLVLGLALEADPGLDATVPGRNTELLATLRAFVAGQVPEPWVYLWGEPGAGRTHWLRAACREAERLGRDAVAWTDGIAPPPGGFVAVDDVETLTADAQIHLFNILNQARDGACRCLVAGNAPPAQLAVRDDVRTRLGASLVYRVHPLDDEGKVQVLERLAAARGFDLPPDVARYLLTRGSRDLPALVRSLDLLDRASLERQRPLTVPLLREAFRESGLIPGAVPPADTDPSVLAAER